MSAGPATATRPATSRTRPGRRAARMAMSTSARAPCGLAFGTSTGALGFRKFPNPRFDEDAWRELNGSLASWEGYRANLAYGDAADPDTRNNRLFDGSIEPPFRIGMACGGCHIAFDPLNPPDDPEHPEWENISGTVGNQYLRISEMLGSGMPRSSLEWQIVARARPGTVDTSALPNDVVTNPGTMNAIINFGQRPLHEHEVTRWHQAASCPAGADERECWCEPGKPGKCWERRTMTEMVPNILKGGEDSIGFNGAVQRVYFNIGSCSEQCWVNHIPDLRQADPQAAQLRPVAVRHRPVPPRLPELPGDRGPSRRHRRLPGHRAAERSLPGQGPTPRRAISRSSWSSEFGEGAIDRGREVFAADLRPLPLLAVRAVRRQHRLPCDGCGRSDAAPRLARQRRADAGDRGRHALCARAALQPHGGPHLAGVRLRDPARQAAGRRPRRDPQGRRARLLPQHLAAQRLGACAVHAQQRDRAGAVRRPRRRHLRLALCRTRGKPLPARAGAACWPFDPSVEGRFELFLESVDQLLNPDKRTPKVTR